jgi:hypothetical protein
LFDSNVFPQMPELLDRWDALRRLLTQDAAAPALSAALEVDGADLLRQAVQSMNQDVGETLLLTPADAGVSPEVQQAVLQIVERATREDWDKSVQDPSTPPLSTVRKLAATGVQPELGSHCLDALEAALAAECNGDPTGLLRDDVELLLRSLHPDLINTFASRAALTLAAGDGVVANGFFEKFAPGLLDLAEFTRSTVLRDKVIPDLLDRVDEGQASWILELVQRPDSVFRTSSAGQLTYVRTKARERREVSEARVFRDLVTELDS